MAFQYDPNQQGQFPQENNGQAMQQQGPPPPQGLPQQAQQPLQQQPGQDGSSPAPFAQQGGVDGSGEADAKTTLCIMNFTYPASLLLCYFLMVPFSICGIRRCCGE
ncbi:hypothetical protein LHYA1_G007493 [Lachnellula hyalina]|uniref:Uncharacterized protein n=1 Tax=Lachnellula hyalina TaxID=1316788 RepID=A0A8H8QY41_9HELO|nr:uncharacterized protein LHYA1_G007493 [Lachnellula hyalina]TVY24873.1 hypothetical protein LHYA1_G007493 [Lachnellula hyalina]